MLSVSEIQHKDIELIADYWLKSDPGFLTGMGVDLNKLPDRDALFDMLKLQIATPYESKSSYALIWLIDGQPAGHCNVNNIRYGEDAFMHLHLWNSHHRRRGSGAELVRLSLPYFFKNLQLKTLFCEPYALNPAPNKTLEKTGFTFVEEYVTVPGALNFEQKVKRWQMDFKQFEQLFIV